MARIALLVTLVVAAAATQLLPPDASGSVTFTVNTAADGADAGPGDGACATTASKCTLRAAVEEANALAGTDTVNLPAGTYDLTANGGGAIEITDDLRITGHSARDTAVRQELDGNQAGIDRVFDIVGAGTTVRLTRMTIARGRATDAAGYFGGNIRSAGTLTVSQSTITDGRGSSAGGIANTSGDLTVIDSTIASNRAPDGGGDAGAILNIGSTDTAARLTVISSTITGNSARLAGGIFSYGNAGNRVTIANSTITDNESQDRGGGGGLDSADGTVATVTNTIIAGNRSPFAVDPSTPNCSAGNGGTIVSGGHNLESATDCAFTAAGDLQNADPLLAALADNGGGTDTHAIPAGSPARDAGDSADCPSTDQRGALRPQGAACDIGAFEFPAGPAARTAGATDVTPETARLTGAVDPASQPTTYRFEYGATTAYGSETPSASAGPGAGEQAVSADVAGLQPEATYHYRLRASSPAGTAVGDDVSFTTPAPPAQSPQSPLTEPSLTPPVANLAKPLVPPLTLEDLPAPELAKTVNTEPVSGKVFVSLPVGAGAARALGASPIKGRVFVPLEEARQVPVGSYLDTTQGRVRVASAAARAGATQTGEFTDGIFQVLQGRRERGLTELRLQGSDFTGGCPGAGRARAARKRLSDRTIRRLRANAKGSFRTRGRFAAATVRGTEWDTIDRCDGTLTRVRRGTVDVLDLRRKKTVVVKAGKSYFARAPS